MRVYGINTAERGQRCFNEAKDRFEELAGDLVRVQLGPRTTDPFDRLLYYVLPQDGSSIDELLIREEFDTIQVWKLQKLSTNAFQSSLFSVAT